MKADVLRIKICQIGDINVPIIPGWFELYLLEGKSMRNDVYIDFTEAGNWLRYDWLDKGEFVVGCHDSTEIIPDMVHEIAECIYTLEHNFNIMNNDDQYSEAHNYASSQEQPVRDDPTIGLATLQEWINKYLALQEQTIWQS